MQVVSVLFHTIQNANNSLRDVDDHSKTSESKPCYKEFCLEKNPNTDSTGVYVVNFAILRDLFAQWTNRCASVTVLLFTIAL